MLSSHSSAEPCKKSPPLIKPQKDSSPSPTPFTLPVVSSTARVPPLPLVMDYVWQHSALKTNTFSSYTSFPWLSNAAKLGFGLPSSNSTFFFPKYDVTTTRLYPSAFRPVYPSVPPSLKAQTGQDDVNNDEEETVDIETCNEEEPKTFWPIHTPEQVRQFLN